MRQRPTPDEDKQRINKYCVEKCFVSQESDVRAFLDQVQAPYRTILQREGHTLEYARAKLDELFADASIPLHNSKNQGELEHRIKNSTEPDQNNISPCEAIRSLPAFVTISPFEFDVRTWMLAAVNPEGLWSRTREAMRYLEVWNDKVSKEERQYIIQRLIETDEYDAGHPFALYSKEIVHHFSDDPTLINTIIDSIEKSNAALPLLSALRLSAMPKRLYDYAKKYIKIDDNIMHSDNVISVQHVNNYAGDCIWLRQGHHFTLVQNRDPDIYGNVTLLYVDHQLIGSMKMHRHNSIIGLRTVQDSHKRYPVVLDGTYVTTKEITQQAKEAHEQQGKWAKLYLDQLPLFPIRFAHQKNDGIEEIRNYAKILTDVRKRIE